VSFDFDASEKLLNLTALSYWPNSSYTETMPWSILSSC